MTAYATRDHPLGPAPAAPVLTASVVARLGVESSTNLAALIFRRKHAGLSQYDGFLDEQTNVRLVTVNRDPSTALNTFSRFEPGDVLLAWDTVSSFATGARDVVAFCPRVGWNVNLMPGIYEEM